MESFGLERFRGLQRGALLDRRIAVLDGRPVAVAIDLPGCLSSVYP